MTSASLKITDRGSLNSFALANNVIISVSNAAHLLYLPSATFAWIVLRSIGLVIIA